MEILLFSKDKSFLHDLQSELKQRQFKVEVFFEDVHFIQKLHALKHNERTAIVFDITNITNPLLVPNLMNAVHKNIYTIVCTPNEKNIMNEFTQMGVHDVICKEDSHNEIIPKLSLIQEAYKSAHFGFDNRSKVTQLLGSYRLHQAIIHLREELAANGSDKIDWKMELQKLQTINEGVLKEFTQPIATAHHEIYDVKDLFSSLVTFWRISKNNVICEVDRAFVRSDPKHMLFILDDIVQSALNMGITEKDIKLSLLICTNNIRQKMLVVRMDICNSAPEIRSTLQLRIGNGLFERLCESNGIYYDVQLKSENISIEFAFEDLVDDYINVKVVNV